MILMKMMIFVYFECVVVCERGAGGIEQSRRQRNGVLFVCFVLVRVVSTWFDNSSNSVCE